MEIEGPGLRGKQFIANSTKHYTAVLLLKNEQKHPLSRRGIAVNAAFGLLIFKNIDNEIPYRKFPELSTINFYLC
jgi:hypothetical protein